MPPSSYTPDATATQSPAAQPEPGNAPVESLPASGDGVTAASVAQMIKAAADQIAWLKTPRAKVSTWGQPIFQYKNARFQTRAIIDQLGYPAGKLLRWTEDWSDAGFTSKGNTDTTDGPWASRWNFGLPGTGTNASVAVTAPDSDFPMSSRAVLALDATSTSATNFEQVRGSCVADNDRGITIQWDAMIENAGDLGTIEMAMGLHLDTQLYSTAGAFTAIASGAAAFVKRTGDANWQCWTKAVSGSPLLDDTGVAVTSGGIPSFRIEITGSGVSDDSTARVNYFVNATHIVSRAVSLGAHQVRAFARLARTASGTVAPEMSIGVIDFCSNLRSNSVML